MAHPKRWPILFNFLLVLDGMAVLGVQVGSEFYMGVSPNGFFQFTQYDLGMGGSSNAIRVEQNGIGTSMNFGAASVWCRP